MSEASLNEVKCGVTPFAVEKLLLERWSPRAFASTPVSAEDLKTIFTAGAWAASSYNEQPWRFVLGRAGSAEWQKIFDALISTNQGWAKSAPVLFASFAKKTFTRDGSPNNVAMHDVGAASTNIALQASALGLHVHGMGGFDRSKLSKAFKAPEDFEPVACWALGYLGDPGILSDLYKQLETAPRQRKQLDDFVFSDWDKPAL